MDNVTTQSSTPATLPDATVIGSVEAAFSGDTVQIGLAALASIAGSEGARTATLVSDTNPLPTTGGTLTGSSPATASVSNSSTQMVASNSSRKAIFITNVGSVVVFLAFGTAAISNRGIALYPGGTFGPYPNTTQAINGICASSSTLAIQEFE